MRFALLLALAACSGPISPPIGSHSAGSRSTGTESRVMRPPPNAPPDPIGTTRPGDRSCTEDRDCRAGSRCYPPDYKPPARPLALSPPPVASSPAPGAPLATPVAPSTSPGAPAAPGAPLTPGALAAPPGTPAAPGSPVAPSGTPAAPPGSPPPTPQICQTDAQCAGGQVCDDGRCGPPCTLTSCSADRECRSGGHCALIPCNDPRATTCAQNSRCNASSGTCDRQPCTSRSQCDTGVCFQGRCYAHDAYCMP